MTEAPTNPRLVRAIAAMLDAPDEAMDLMMRPLLGELVEATLVAATSSGPARAPRTVRRRGQPHLALFTDAVELHLFASGEPWIALRADEAIKRVARGDYGGLVVNPGPRELVMSRDDVRDFFDIDEG